MTKAKEKARSRGGKVLHTYSHAIKGYSAKLSKQALAAVKADPNVLYVEQNRTMSIQGTQTNATWGLDRIDQRAPALNQIYNYGPTGQGVKAYIIDTGILTTHTDLGGRATSGFDAVDGGTADDCNGHGTHVSGTVGGTTYGVAKRVALVAVRVLDCGGSGTYEGVIAGIDWVTENHQAGQPAVANMSLGGGASQAVDDAVTRSIADGVSYAIAAGNSNADACGFSPARTPNAITVGATTNTDARASFSNIGSCVDIFAPGQNITSSWIGSNTATNTISGTSMATPHVAGAAAVYLQSDPSASPAQVTSYLTSQATPDVVGGPGAGSPNKLLYSPPGGGTPDPDPTPTPSPSPSPTPSPSPEPTPSPSPGPNCGGTLSQGNLSGTGATQRYAPYNSPAGLQKGCLTGPSGVDFDLYLYKWSGSYWYVVASSLGPNADETIAWNAPAGRYRWEVYSYRGSGAFSFELKTP